MGYCVAEFGSNYGHGDQENIKRDLSSFRVGSLLFLCLVTDNKLGAHGIAYASPAFQMQQNSEPTQKTYHQSEASELCKPSSSVSLWAKYRPIVRPRVILELLARQ